MPSIIDKLEGADEIDDAQYDPSVNRVTVVRGEREFSDVEIELIREGKLTPLVAGDWDMTYDAHITLEEQDENAASKFTFNE